MDKKIALIEKKAQITFFIIIGIVILFILFLANYITTLETAKTAPTIIVTNEKSVVETYVSKCLEQTTKNAVLTIAQNSDLDTESSEKTDFVIAPYYLLREKKVSPSKQQLEELMARFIEKELLFCLKFFTPLKERGLNITAGEKIAHVTLLNKSVLVTLEYPVNIHKNENTVTISQFTAVVNTQFGKMHELIEQYLEQEKKDSASICVSCLTNVFFEQGFAVVTNPIDTEDYLLTIIDNTILIDEKELIYHFKIKLENEDNGQNIEEQM